MVLLDVPASTTLEFPMIWQKKANGTHSKAPNINCVPIKTMTSWPWMTGIDVAIADPADPVCPEDERPSVKDLITEHREKIDKMKAEIEKDPLYEEGKHDDLWIMRFFLSHKKTKTAIKAALYTLNYRKEHKLDEKDIRDDKPHKVEEGPVHEYFSTRAPNGAIFAALPDQKRGIIEFVTVARIKQELAMEKISEETWMYAYVFFSEWVHQWLDYVTRTTGRLTKATRFLDLEEMSMKHVNIAATRRDGKAMGLMEDCYPQGLGTVLVCNAPSWMHIPWKITRPLLPTRVVSKMDFVDPARNEKERTRLFKYISEDNLPEHFGGKNKVPPIEW